MKYLKISIALLLLCFRIDTFAQIYWDTESPPGFPSLQREIRPANYQLYPRDLNNKGTVRFKGTADYGYSYIYIKATETPKDSASRSFTRSSVIGSNGFDISIEIDAELSEYTFEYRLYNAGYTPWEVIADHVVCGDAFIIDGQSNATTDNLIDSTLLDSNYGNTSDYGEYERSFGQMGWGFNTEWGLSRVSWFNNSQFKVGAWGLYLQHMIAEEYGIPTCIINGAQGGTDVADHTIPSSAYAFFIDSIFGRINFRVYMAGLENGIKSIFWYQGEDDCHDYTSRQTYLERFNTLYNLWHTYFPGYSKTYVIQVHAYGDGSHEKIIHGLLRELPSNFPDLEVMSSNGILEYNCDSGINGIHFLSNGYVNLGKRLLQLLERDWYCVNQNLENFTPPNIQKIYPNNNDNTLVLEFDQNIGIQTNIANDALSLIWLNNSVTSASASCSATILGNKYIIASSNNWIDWGGSGVGSLYKIQYLCNIPNICSIPSENKFIRGEKCGSSGFNDPAYNIGALSFYEDIPFYGSGTVTENYLLTHTSPYSDNISYSNGRITGIISTDHKGYEVFNDGYAEVPNTADIEFKAARKIILTTGFKANYGSHVLMMTGTDLFAFTSDNNCELLGGNKSMVQSDNSNYGGSDFSVEQSINNENVALNITDADNSGEQQETFFKVFPNPSRGYINLAYSLNEGSEGIFVIFDIYGHELFSCALSEGTHSLQIPNNLLANGVYIYRAIAGETIIATDRIIVLK